MLCFFFQGEDGIRDVAVTGVQTCALPISHVSQRRLAEGGRGGAAQWILEGHADWVKVQVLDLLGFRPYRESRDAIGRSINGSKMAVKFFPDPGALATNAGWTSARNPVGDPAAPGPG